MSVPEMRRVAGGGGSDWEGLAGWGRGSRVGIVGFYFISFEACQVDKVAVGAVLHT